MAREPGIWFPAKRYGWGWGPPIAWQGWAVLIGWAFLLGAGTLWLVPEHPMGLGVFWCVMIALIMVVCYAKGEPPRWRWGNDRE